MAFHGSCHKKKICTEEGITNKTVVSSFIFKQLKKNEYVKICYIQLLG